MRLPSWLSQFDSRDRPGVTFGFVANPGRRTAKNRWHLDLPDDAEATVNDTLAAGATRASDFDASDRFVVLRDPEGNEFCVLTHAATSAPLTPPQQAKP